MWFELVAAVGVTLILTMSRIAAPVRAAVTYLYLIVFPKAKHCPVNCSQCMGVWCGWATGAVCVWLGEASSLHAFLLGPACSVTAYLTYLLIDKLDPIEPEIR